MEFFFPFPLPAGVPLTFLLLRENVKDRKAKRAQGAQCPLLSFCVGCVGYGSTGPATSNEEFFHKRQNLLFASGAER